MGARFLIRFPVFRRMNRLVTNLASLVIFPSLVVTGFLYVIYRALDGWTTERAIGPERAALVVLGIGIYFLGHPLYPALVPLINASTSWMFAVGGVYVTLGSISVVLLRHRHFSAIGSWLAAVLGVAIGLLAANEFEVGMVVRLVEGSNFVQSLYLSLPLALLFPIGYSYHHDDRKRPILPLVLVFTLYALALANSIPLMERVRGPVAVVFIAFGCIGVLLGTPLYVLGTTLASSPDER